MGWKDTPKDREIARLLKEAVCRGDQSSEKEHWEKIYQNYYQRVLRLATKRISRSNLLKALDPEDITSQVFIEVRHSIGAYDLQRRFDSWIMGIVVNCARRAIAEYYEPLKRLAGIEAACINRDSNQGDKPVNEALARMEIEKLHNYFNSTGNELFFRILELKYFHEMPDLEIAVSIGEVKTADSPKALKAAGERIRQWRVKAEELALRFLSDESSNKNPEGSV